MCVYLKRENIVFYNHYMSLSQLPPGFKIKIVQKKPINMLSCLMIRCISSFIIIHLAESLSAFEF